jgi:hypothetical protein
MQPDPNDAPGVSAVVEAMRRLSPGQRDCFQRGTGIGFYARSRPQRNRMVALGVAVPTAGLRDTLAMDWTALGLAVRSALAAPHGTGGGQ